MTVSVISQAIRWEGRGCKDVCWKMGVGMRSEGVTENMWRDWTDQSKAQSQRAYIETPL
jgi:hypothetical protein